MIDVQRRNDVTVVAMEHGKVNLLDVPFLASLGDVLTDLEGDPTGGGVVLTGRGNVFSAGVDLFKVLDGGGTYLDTFLPALHDALLRLFSLPRPVVAAINGHAIAGGCVLACTTDLRVMAEGDARIGMPEVRVGVPFPAAIFEFVRAAVGPRWLSEIVYLGRTYTPETARRRGLVDEIVPADEVLSRAIELAAEMGQVAPDTFALTKRQVRGPVLATLDQAMDGIEAEIRDVWKRPETHAAIRAYLKNTLG